MLRKKVAVKKSTDHIKWRGQEVTRIEAFSDAVFAFAVTLLIMSLEVPHDYKELMSDMKGILPFGLCFLIVFTVWYNQNLFFRRYGLHDLVTITLNAILLFLVLMYMFPLKYLMAMIFRNGFVMHPEQQGEVKTLLSLYCGGFLVFNVIFTLMYWNAYRRGDHIGLTEVEEFQTLSHAYSYLIVTSVSLLAVCVALLGDEYASFACLAFALLWPAMTIFDRKRKKIFKLKFPNEQGAEVKQHMHAHIIHDPEEN